MKADYKLKSGFTLIELVIVIAILAVVSYIIASFIVSATDAWVFVKSRETALSQGRFAVERIVRELRRIDVPLSITVHSSTECQFFDIDDNIINIKQSATDLLYSENYNANILTTGLADPGGLNFKYYDSSLAETSTMGDVQYIRVQLSLVSGTQSITLWDGARLRNL